MEYLDVAQLLAAREETSSGMPEDDVTIPGLGIVRVRGMNREETLSVQKIEDHAERDCHLTAIGMVRPRMSVSQVKAWNKRGTGGELEAVSRRIGELSGLIEGQAKAVYQEFEADPDTEFRSLPDAETGLALGGADEGRSE